MHPGEVKSIRNKFFRVEQRRFERSENQVCNESVLKLHLQVTFGQFSYRQVPGSIPDRGSINFFFDSVPPLFHSNFQS